MSASDTNTKTIGIVHPEEDNVEVTLQTEINGWTYDPSDLPAPVAWRPTNRDNRVRITYMKTGPNEWTTKLTCPTRTPDHNTLHETFDSPDEAITAATQYMNKHSPDEVIEQYAPNAYTNTVQTEDATLLPLSDDSTDNWVLHIADGAYTVTFEYVTQQTRGSESLHCWSHGHTPLTVDPNTDFVPDAIVERLRTLANTN